MFNLFEGLNNINMNSSGLSQSSVQEQKETVPATTSSGAHRTEDDYDQDTAEANAAAVTESTFDPWQNYLRAQRVNTDVEMRDSVQPSSSSSSSTSSSSVSAAIPEANNLPKPSIVRRVDEFVHVNTFLDDEITRPAF
jgi:hypothetical protein